MSDIIYTSAESASTFLAQNLKWELTFNHSANRFSILHGDGDYYQDLGNDSSTGQLYFIFDVESPDEAAFYNAIRERGAGTVTQPDRNETLNIQPLSVTKSLGLVDDVLRTLYNVTFATSRTPGEVSSTQALYSALVTQNTDAVESAGEVLAASQDVESLVDSTRQVANFTAALNSATRHLGTVASEIEGAIDDIVSDPVAALIAFKQLIEQPGIIFSRITNKLQGYQDLVLDLLNIETYPAQTQKQRANDLFFAEAMVSTVMATKTQAAADTGFETKQGVITTANQLVAEYGTSRDSLDQYQQEGAFQQSGTTQESTSKLVNSTAAFLFGISFDLKTEFLFTVDAPITIYDILADYYTDKLAEVGEVDTMNYIIQTNSLVASEILEIPTGREILVYV